MSRKERSLFKRFAGSVFRDQLFEHGAFGRGNSGTVTGTAKPNNLLLGRMPHQPEPETDEEEDEVALDEFLDEFARRYSCQPEDL